MHPYRTIHSSEMYESLFSCQSQCELNILFGAFRVMAEHGFISLSAYDRFMIKSSGVEYHDDVGRVVDINIES